MVILGGENQGRLRIAGNPISLPADGRADGSFRARLVFAEKLFPVFDKADQHHYR